MADNDDDSDPRDKVAVDIGLACRIIDLLEGHPFREDAASLEALACGKEMRHALGGITPEQVRPGLSPVDELGALKLAAHRVERACNRLAATRSDEAYAAQMACGQADDLIELDFALGAVRNILQGRPNRL